MKTLPRPWTAAMEATLFTRWIYERLKPRGGGEGSESAGAAGHPDGEKEKRPHRRQQDLRLPALRFSAGVLRGLDGDSRKTARSAASQSVSPPRRATEKQNRCSADGGRGDLQQA